MARGKGYKHNFGGCQEPQGRAPGSQARGYINFQAVFPVVAVVISVNRRSYKVKGEELGPMGVAAEHKVSPQRLRYFKARGPVL